MIEFGSKITLKVNDWTLHNTGTLEHRDAGLETLERLKKNHSEYVWEFREYMAAIHKTKNDVCISWTKEGGWSIWYMG